MAVKIGIPRALLYYEYYPLWKTFFERLGAEVILSDKTSKSILNDGIQAAVGDACLPVKLFHGHVINLIGKADYIFIPRLRSVHQNEYICPKFTGLPEMIKFSVKDLLGVICTEVYLRKSLKRLNDSFLDAGGYLTKDRNAIKEAAKTALFIHREYIKNLEDGRLPCELLKDSNKISENRGGLNIAVIGHQYNIYDSYINMRLLEKLAGQKVNILTPETVKREIIEDKGKKLSKNMYWSLGKRQLCSALYWSETKSVDGIIYVMSFGCGVDSFVSELCEKSVRAVSDIPYILLTLDEHTGEAGIGTRLEAFLDMIRWRRRDENNISAHR